MQFYAKNKKVYKQVGSVSWRSVKTFCDISRFGPRFPPASQSYSLKLRQLAGKVAKDIGFESFVREGVYCYLGGPSFETVTECRFLKLAGVDATGKIY